MTGLSLVTGANGHLGNNLVRTLAGRGERVRAGVRNLANADSLEDSGSEIVHLDLMDKDSLLQALEGVETLYQVAAVFRLWARDPEQEIIRPNLEGTRNVLEAAAESGVKRVVYVSSSTTLERSSPYQKRPIDETSWTASYYGNPYTRSKVESERLAWRLAQELGLSVVSVLPSTMIGPNCFRLTPSMGLLERVVRGALPVDMNIRFNFVDVRDVADGMIAAAERGRAGQRYILAGDESMGIPRLIELASEFSPGLQPPPKVPRSVLMAAASIMELGGRLTGREPALVRSQVRMFYGTEQELAAEKARRELGYTPRSSEEAVRECFAYLIEREENRDAA
jgi:nucleoside-diphosphate-sugar epimerase